MVHDDERLRWQVFLILEICVNLHSTISTAVLHLYLQHALRPKHPYFEGLRRRNFYDQDGYRKGNYRKPCEYVIRRFNRLTVYKGGDKLESFKRSGGTSKPVKMSCTPGLQ